jgi:hypothetical protein
MNAARARQDAMMTELASAQAVLTERINQVVNDAITNALSLVVCCTRSAPEPEHLRLDIKMSFLQMIFIIICRVLSGDPAGYGAADSQDFAIYDFFPEVGCCFVVSE